MVVTFLFFVLEHQAVQLVDQQVDGRIHGGAAGICVHGATGKVDGGDHMVVWLANGQLRSNFTVLVEMALQSLQLACHVLPQGGGHFKLMAIRLDTHRIPPLVGGPMNLSGDPTNPAQAGVAVVATSGDAHAFVGGGNVHGFTILRNGAPRYRDAGSFQQICQLGIG
ncbi:hypothetical protein XHV734_2135 [Xanthomonas hortorum pv. vitians]|nr:hypothetical protein XHV734_2135 [Xanthomonas hortorum pv. vitians]